ncbi:MAG: GNAT family N-acetyltransferase [Chloroflexi bacterium]|nr:GNAT family N-acetyltransferase [Chloroflexota bacterium]
MTEIELEPFTRADFGRLIAWSPTPEFLLQWSGPIFYFPLDEAQLENYMRGAEGDDPVRKIFRVVDRADGAVVGHIELGEINLANRSATICRVLIGDPAMRGRGLGEQMVRRVLAIGFGELGLHRIDLGVFEFNHAAIACYEKIGFRIEGLRRDARRIGDAYWSAWTMSILEHEWTNI